MYFCRIYIFHNDKISFLNADKELITGPNIEQPKKQTKWCHGEFDYLQLDQRTMANYSDVGSKQQRYCGKITPEEYVSNTNVLIIEMKTNSDSIRGKGFRLRWEAVSGKYKFFKIIVSLKMRLSHSVMIYTWYLL